MFHVIAPMLPSHYVNGRLAGYVPLRRAATMEGAVKVARHLGGSVDLRNGQRIQIRQADGRPLTMSQATMAAELFLRG